MAGDSLKSIIEELRGMAEWPPEGYVRRTKTGYPLEAAYNQFAYERMVDGYRKAFREMADRLESALDSPPA